MRLNVPKATIEATLIQLINDGHSLVVHLEEDYQLKAGKNIRPFKTGCWLAHTRF
jgi:hypothetical protein